MLYIVNKGTKDLKEIQPDSFRTLKIWERKDLEKWIEAHPEILGEELFVITTEYDQFDKTDDRLDILALDKNGKLVIIELKRDMAPTTTELQAIKYAAFCSNLTFEDIISIYTEREKAKEQSFDTEEAENELKEFIQNKGFEDLDNQPRIILVAGEFKQETTATVLWLRSFGIDISCVKLKLYSLKDELGKETIAINPSIIIPLPEAKDFIIDRERKETEIAGMTKSQKFYKEFYERLIERFKKECPGITESGGTKGSWLSLPIGYTDIHFEWWFRKRPKPFFEVGLHFEKPNYEQNKRLLSELEKDKSYLEAQIGETITFDYQFGKQWCRLCVMNENIEDTEALETWIIDTTKKFYKILKPRVDKILIK